MLLGKHDLRSLRTAPLQQHVQRAAKRRVRRVVVGHVGAQHPVEATIERGERLVEQAEVGLQVARARDPDPRLLPARDGVPLLADLRHVPRR